jgi:GxxExxY protein
MTQKPADRSVHRVKECYETLFEEALTRRIIGAFYDVYNALGYGFLESVYKTALAKEITDRGLSVVREAGAEVRYKGEVVGLFRADLLIESRVVVELKACRKLESAHPAQVMNYLRAADLEVGLLLHFGPRPAFQRFIATNDHPGARKLRHPSVSSAPSALQSSNAVAVPTLRPHQQIDPPPDPLDTRQNRLQ